MKTTYDLSQLDWKLSGWIPELWRMERTMEIGASPNAEVPEIPAKVPGSVQYSLREAGLIPDWNYGLNYRKCEWVENRHWIYETAIPEGWIEPGKTYRLNCLGLDYCGEVIVNGEPVSEFCGSFIPHVFDITPYLKETDNRLRIVLTCPPRWLGQFGYTSKMKEWKVRFNYTWDWTARLVQTGIWDGIYLESTDGREIREFRCVTDADAAASTGMLSARGTVSAAEGDLVRMSLSREGAVICEDRIPASHFNSVGISWKGIPVDLWWPNMHGDQPMYDLTFALLDSDGTEIDRVTRRIGFKNVAWAGCDCGPAGADPWICVVNGKPVFLQGVNWVPIRPNFADVTEADYRKRLELCRGLGLNILRVWGGAVLEKECFYDLCDKLGLMVWQEFPLSSSGVDNIPPDDAQSVDDLATMAGTYIARRQHHVSLAIWSGGNELMYLDGTPCDTNHPMIARLAEVAQENDPTHRFLVTSASGPTNYGVPDRFGQGVHWDVHGPWKAEGKLDEQWTTYWSNDDALFRSETGAPGTSSAEMIRRYAGDQEVMPALPENPLWRRTSVWWIEWHHFVAENGREPASLEEYVEWSQARQARALSIAVKACKDRFPRCGGIILWMGHDCFPCTANTSIVDFDGNPKPAALAVGRIFRQVGSGAME